MSLKLLKYCRKRAINDRSDSPIPSKKLRTRNKVEIVPESIQIKAEVVPKPKGRRKFYHIRSLTPYFVKRNDEDSDDETLHQEWNQRKINENRILNEGEKAMMNLWNGFIDRQPIPRGWKNMHAFCRTFIDGHIKDIVKKRLTRNFILHLCNLKDIGSLGSVDCLQLIQYMQSRMGIQSKVLERILANHFEKPKPKTAKKSSLSTSSKQTRRKLRSVTLN